MTSNGFINNILDTFKGQQYKRKLIEVQQELFALKSTFTPEMAEPARLMELTRQLSNRLSTLEHSIADRNAVLFQRSSEISALDAQIVAKRSQLVHLDDEAEMQSFALYAPHFEFSRSEQYKDRLKQIRDNQKALIRNGQAVTGNMNWTVNGKASQGRKMVNDMQKLLLRAFNSECDDCIDHVRFSNVALMEKRIRTACESISKLGSIMSISITDSYLGSKLEELFLAHEYQQKKQEEKEHIKQLRADERERVKLEKEIETARRKIEKEQAHYSSALALVTQQLAVATDPDDISALNSKKAELEAHEAELEKAMRDVDYREANQKAGYVYIISNIGAFGENVYKIGMTRRLEPTDRVDELGDASVPFNFDIHALIFSDDAPKLEAALHRAFEGKKLNMINPRREFFRVSLDEIKEVVLQNYDKTVEFIDVPAAEQYRQSLIIAEGR